VPRPSSSHYLPSNIASDIARCIVQRARVACILASAVQCAKRGHIVIKSAQDNVPKQQRVTCTWMLQAFVVTADYIRDEANDSNKCVTCDRAFRDAAERQRFMSKQVCCFTLFRG